MIEVIERVRYKYTIECPECNSILKYDKDDVETKDFGRGRSWHYYYITCPICKKEITDGIFEKKRRFVDFGKPHQFEGPL